MQDALFPLSGDELQSEEHPLHQGLDKKKSQRLWASVVFSASADACTATKANTDARKKSKIELSLLTYS